MFSSTKVFSSFSIKDLDKAKRFYSNTLGITVKDDPMGFIELQVTGNQPVILYPRENHEPATFTVLNFVVDDIDKAVDALMGKGITFEQYSEHNTDVKGISRESNGPQIAWFKDPAGNILSVLQEGDGN